MLRRRQKYDDILIEYVYIYIILNKEGKCYYCDTYKQHLYYRGGLNCAGGEGWLQGIVSREHLAEYYRRSAAAVA